MKRSLRRGRGVGRPENWDGVKLRAARERAELSRRELAESLALALGLDSLSQGTVECWETGRARPTLKTVRALRLILRARL